MWYLYIFSLSLITCLGNFQSVVQDAKLDNKELRCLVCEASIKEIGKEIMKSDNSQTIKVGGHRLDAEGNYDAPKTIPITKSELFLSDVIDVVCNKMDDYVRALWKSNGSLTLLNMVEDGRMNPLMGDVDFVQDEDLNKSLKYYCEGIMAEFEENIIKHYQNGDDDVSRRVCSEDSGLCAKNVKHLEL